MADDGSIKIEMGVPMPNRPRGPGRACGPATMAIRMLARAPIGASVFIAGKTPRNIGPFIDRSGFGFGWAATRAAEGGCRVWKIAEPKQAPKDEPAQ